MDPTDNKNAPAAEDNAGTQDIDAALDAGLGAGDADEGIAAIDKAIAEADAEVDAPAGKDPVGDPSPASGKPEGGGEGSPDGQQPGAGKDPGDGNGKPQPNAEDVEEAKSLGLKDRANERFVAMAGEIRGFAPFKAALEQAGVKDAADLPKMVERARAADDMIAMVMETGADAEQYGKSLDYLALVNKGLSGDRAAAEKAFELVSEEYLSLAKALGREVPGLHDPVAEFKDLVDEVGTGDLTRARALEVARQRQNDRAAQQRAEQQRQQQQGAQQQEQRVEAARIALNTWDRQMVSADPNYVAKRPALDAAVKEIREKLPPEQWIEATKQAYAAIPDPKPQKEEPPLPSAVRGSGVSRPLELQEFGDTMEAMEAALAG